MNGSSTGRASGAAAQVLVIEDDPDLQDAVVEALSQHGYIVRAAASGEDALALLHDGGGKVCLVLLDLSLDGMTGWEVLARQSLDPDIRSVPVIVMTGLDEVDETGRPKAWVHTLHKPVHLDELVDAVHRFAR